jgi:hypothetical protein
MYENTLEALKQVIDHMREAAAGGPEAVAEFFEDMSAAEHDAYFELLVHCREFDEWNSALEYIADELELTTEE